jgi:peptidoglycan hydrolase-like protein with peptidoglycan-binding domain
MMEARAQAESGDARLSRIRAQLTRRRLLAGSAVLVAVVGIGVAVTDPFASHAAFHGSRFDNGSPTSTRQIERRSLVSQTPVNGTLGYAGSWTVSVPSVTAYGSAAIYTKLPSAGDVVRRGQRLFAIDGQAVLFLYGAIPAWRTFRAGMTAGPDVGELNANLSALGYDAPTGGEFTTATAAAISRLQQAHGLPQTGTLQLGAVVFEPGPLRVTALTPTVGQPVEPGPLLTATSTRREVAVQLDAGEQSQVKTGDRVTVTLPDNSTTPGVVTSVGKVATTLPSDQNAGGGPGSPTIEVGIRLIDSKAAGTLDQAPVNVSITESSVRNALVVPVTALLALAGGGYAVEEVEANGTHRLVAVKPGLFDDATGLVQVSGSGLAAGQRVVVPAS